MSLLCFLSKLYYAHVMLNYVMRFKLWLEAGVVNLLHMDSLYMSICFVVCRYLNFDSERCQWSEWAVLSASSTIMLAERHCIMLEYAPMLHVLYYAKNYAGLSPIPCMSPITVWDSISLIRMENPIFNHNRTSLYSIHPHTPTDRSTVV